MESVPQGHEPRSFAVLLKDKASNPSMTDLGESKNTLRKLADLRDDVELFELADDVAGALQARGLVSLRWTPHHAQRPTPSMVFFQYRSSAHEA